MSNAIHVCGSTALLALITALGACGKGKDSGGGTKVSVRPSLYRMNATNFTTPKAGLTDLQLNSQSEFKTTDVKILSFKYPIGLISLSSAPTAPGTTASASGNNSFPVYECKGSTNDECLVELTGDALKNLLADAPAREARLGTFSQVNISPCATGASSKDVTIKVTAEVVMNGTTYYTHPTKGLSTTAPAAEVAFKPDGGCGSVTYLSKELTIGVDDVVAKPVSPDNQSAPATPVSGELKSRLDLKFYFDLANAVVARAGSPNPGDADFKPSGFCQGERMGNPHLCVNFPQVIGTIDAGEPTLTRMLVNDHTIWGFYSSSDGMPFGAYQRSYFNGLYSADPDFLVGAMFARFKTNADKSIDVEQIDDGQNRQIKVKGFKLEDHSGTFTKGGTTVNYSAKKI